MKSPSQPVHSRISVNSVCFFAATLQQQSEYWRILNAHTVSLIAPQLDNHELGKVQQTLQSCDCEVETIVHNFVAGAPLDPNPASWHKPREQLQRRIDEARQLGARSIYMLTGGRGDMDWEDAAAVFAEAIKPCVAYAQQAGVQLMIENAPAQYADIHIAHSLRDTVTLAELANIGVCIDLFFCWAEADLKHTIERCIPRCGLVQVSDYVLGDRNLPARAVVGDGAIPLTRLLQWIIDAGYSGAFELELIGPRIDQETPLLAVKRSIDALNTMLPTLGA
ncbi:sugar phosphate isomerase/epimerase [Pseudomaricurvus sp. HS19]|uniref:sugar phosphate isomerase/epimerase family protein n=1 Tax=Pseudomaricurvus sp. HS19 TaxID=2692626 RepID=UPI00136A74E1|nr:sugar phosphate isomerase/epimerase family protein [Pseudomaricurvus sp. HS19]MYM63878.1 TIM barrel protein [Pseudomaricurvus sp. HS19]